MNKTFKNTSYFIIPVWFDNMEKFGDCLGQIDGWDKMDSKKLKTNYLFSYACKLTQNSKRFVKYIYSKPIPENLYISQDMDEDYSKEIKMEELSFSAFDSGIGFLEICFTYGNLSLDQINDFIYSFKRVSKGYHLRKNKLDYISYEKYIKDILPSYVEPFFYVTGYFKKECIGFHFVKSDIPLSKEAMAIYRYRFGRGYSTSFNPTGNESLYDVEYAPYENDQWCGSQEGLANIVFDSGNETSD